MLDVVPAIASLRALAEEIRAGELEGASAARPLTRARAAVESITAQIVDKLLHLPTVRMKEAAVTADGVVYAEAVRHLFGLGEEERDELAAADGTAAAAAGADRVRPDPAARRPACGLAEPATRRRRAAPRRLPRSRLALTQAERAAERAAPAGIEIALVPITTAGDRDRTQPFGQIGERGVFVKELEEALLAGRIDVAVHSAKDMTSTDTRGPRVGAYPPREDPRDALCGASASAAGDADRHGVGSPPRAAARARADALDRPLRGNIDTRLRKRGERGLDAVVLAACGLDRLGLGGEIGHRFDPDELLPEAGQGALALQVRAGEERPRRRGDDAETRRRVEAERRCVAAVGGGCLAPVAAHHDGTTLTALVADEDGAWIERRSGDDPPRRSQPSSLARRR